MEVIRSHPMYGEEHRHSFILPLLATLYYVVRRANTTRLID
jgi:hypothetical protein